MELKKTIQVGQGISTFGNSTKKKVLAVDSLSDGAIRNAKTLLKQRWVSWDKTSPSAFLGFNSIDPGRGYVVLATQKSHVKLELASDVQMKKIPALVGENLLALPFKPKEKVGNTKLYEASLHKTIIGGRWRSNTTGSPDGFQGFTNYDKDQGYYVKITKLFKPSASLSELLPHMLASRFGSEYSGLSGIEDVELGYKLSIFNRI